MKLTYKPDFDRAKEMWMHYWEGSVLKRPLVVATRAKDNCPKEEDEWVKYYYPATGRYQKQLDVIDRIMENTDFFAEAIPYFVPDMGPDQFAAFLGAELQFSPQSKNTNWVKPIVADWNQALPLSISADNPIWQRILEFAQKLANHARGRFLVGVCDLHSNIDALSALREAQNLCMDFYDCPELVDRAIKDVRKLYQPVYNALYKASGMNHETGSIGWAPFWCEGRFATIQSDFLCMVSPEISRKYIIPALEEEAGFLDHCVMHFDGPGALPHLDDLLAIKNIDVIQWVSGDGQEPMHTWVDVLKRCQKAGKGLHIYGVDIDNIKSLSKILSPEGLVYDIKVKTRQEVDEITTWLEKNT